MCLIVVRRFWDGGEDDGGRNSCPGPAASTPVGADKPCGQHHHSHIENQSTTFMMWLWMYALIDWMDLWVSGTRCGCLHFEPGVLVFEVSIYNFFHISNNSNKSTKVNSNQSTVSFNNAKNFSIYNQTTNNNIVQQNESILSDSSKSNQDSSFKSFKERLDNIDMK